MLHYLRQCEQNQVLDEFGTLKADTEMSSSTNVTGINNASTTKNGGRVQYTIDTHSEGQGQSIMINLLMTHPLV